jgi:hypothetical protein
MTGAGSSSGRSTSVCSSGRRKQPIAARKGATLPESAPADAATVNAAQTHAAESDAATVSAAQTHAAESDAAPVKKPFASAELAQAVQCVPEPAEATRDTLADCGAV